MEKGLLDNCNYIKLEEPQIVELDCSPSFLLVSHIDYTDIKIGFLYLLGKKFDYGSGEDVCFEGEYLQLIYNLNNPQRITMDKSGKIYE